MLQSLYRCQKNLCTKIRKTSHFVQSLSTRCDSNIPTDESKSLINLCHRKSHDLSKEIHISEAKILQLETDTCSEVSTVVEFFQNHGFSATQMKKVIGMRPRLLASNVDKTLKPKLNFLQSIGFSEDECSKIVSCNPNILIASVRNQLTPCFDSLKTFMGSEAQALDAIRRSPQILNSKISHSWNQTVNVLHQIGIPDSQVLEFIFKSPFILTVNAQKMSEVGLRLKKLGFDVTSTAFRIAFATMSKVSHSKVERKLEAYRSVGFTDAQIINIFRLQPYCMFYSEENIKALVTFYVDRLSMSLSHLSQRSFLLSRSLERRVIPRCSVVQVLWSRGIISKPGKLSSIIKSSEKDFLLRYVTEYETEVPELQAAYCGELLVKEFTFQFREIHQFSISQGSSSKTKLA